MIYDNNNNNDNAHHLVPRRCLLVVSAAQHPHGGVATSAPARELSVTALEAAARLDEPELLAAVPLGECLVAPGEGDYATRVMQMMLKADAVRCVGTLIFGEQTLSRDMVQLAAKHGALKVLQHYGVLQQQEDAELVAKTAACHGQLAVATAAVERAAALYGADGLYQLGVLVQDLFILSASAAHTNVMEYLMRRRDWVLNEDVDLHALQHTLFGAIRGAMEAGRMDAVRWLCDAFPDHGGYCEEEVRRQKRAKAEMKGDGAAAMKGGVDTVVKNKWSGPAVAVKKEGGGAVLVEVKKEGGGAAAVVKKRK